MEKRRFTWIFLFLGFFVFFTSAQTMAASKETTTLIGKETWNFNLASTQDRLINYGDDYYGKSYLIMTFFPAAFTPV
jgi:peroxiredoxin